MLYRKTAHEICAAALCRRCSAEFGDLFKHRRIPPDERERHQRFAPAHRAAKRRAEVLLPNPHIFRDPSPCRTADTAPLFLFIDDCFVGCTHINLSFLVFGYSIQYGMYYIWCIKIVFKLAPSEKFLKLCRLYKKRANNVPKTVQYMCYHKKKKRFYYARSQHSARKNS